MLLRKSDVRRFALILAVALLLSVIAFLRVNVFEYSENDEYQLGGFLPTRQFPVIVRRPPSEKAVAVSNNSLFSEIFTFLKNQRDVPHPHNFQYTINPGQSVCSLDDVFLLTYVHTAPENYRRRLAIRETWGNRDFLRKYFNISSRVVFLMGKPTNEKTQTLVDFESERFGDLVQEDFLDTYRNLTYKGIMAMKWISQYCRQASFILKVDDDIIVNIGALTRHLKSMFDIVSPQNKTILCNLWTRMKVERNVNSKWYLSETDFKEDFFPPYCSGSAYILSGDLPLLLYNASLYTPFFWVDDYYITGLIAEKVNVTYIKLNSGYVIAPSKVEEKFNANPLTVLFGHNSDLSVMYNNWKIVGDIFWKRQFLLGR